MTRRNGRAVISGNSEDYTRASAIASILTAEGQIFAPERIKFDLIMNRSVLSTYKPKYWRFQSLGSPVSDAETLTSMIDSLGEQGALTPNVVIKIANQFLDISIESITEEWGDIPFSVTLATIQAGHTVKGLDAFIKQIAEVAVSPDPEVPGSGKKKPPAKNPAVVKTIKKELKAVVLDVEEALNSVVPVTNISKLRQNTG